MSIGNLIKAGRTRCGMSQKQLAEKSGISENYISMIERGVQKSVTVTTLEQIAAALGATLILSLSDQKSESDHN